MGIWMRIFKDDKLEALKSINAKLMVGLDEGRDTRDAITTLSARITESTEENEALQGLLGAHFEELKEQLVGFINLNGEMVKLLARYFQYELDAIESTKKDMRDALPSEHDKIF